ncbi:sulfite exporter TauE/SafE family protein [Undibacterium terreum]|uniref:sulfite exporter TauE/SafE family protein n=1 Tax=Undibacterium terreum TaxID=1224302 RepID=UPI0016630703|nr:sulfite exporter TauE/SafE family protein [Undibacterium terreum]
MIISLALGILVGSVMGLTGAGGGSIAVPALVAGLGWSMQQAMPVALLAVTGGAAVGAIEGLKKKLVRYRAAMLMALVGIPFTTIGVKVAHTMSQQWLMIVFAIVLLIIAVRLFLQHRVPEGNDEQRHTVCHINAQTGRFDWTLSTGLIIGAIGSLAGFCTGLLGVGGGFVIVPMLRRFTNVSMHGAVATSLLVIALVGASAVASALQHGAELPLAFTLSFVIATAGGMLAGRLFARRLSAHVIQRSFATMLLFVAGGLLLKAAALF